MLELKNISYIVDGEKKILNNLNLKFPENKITVITGQNGSGKSTLIKIIMGILQPTTGEIYFDNKNITNLTIQQRANLGFSIALQQPVRFKGLTVRDLLNLASKNNTTIIDACEFLAQVGLCARDYIDREIDDTLSGGELKRIEIAMALAKGGKVLLFDEPEAGIDLWAFDSLVALFKNIKNKTIIIVSHQRRILDSADYLLVLNNNEAIIQERTQLTEDIGKPLCHKLGGSNVQVY